MSRLYRKPITAFLSKPSASESTPFALDAFLKERPSFSPRDSQTKGTGAVIHVPYGKEVIGATTSVNSTRNIPLVTLFTSKKVDTTQQIAILEELCQNYPHALAIVDVDREENRCWYDRYKYDLPILHMGNYYWLKGTKQTLTKKVAAASLHVASNGSFQPGRDEPNAAEMERQQMQTQRSASVLSDSSTNDNEKKQRPRRASNASFQKMMIAGIRRDSDCSLVEGMDDET